MSDESLSMDTLKKIAEDGLRQGIYKTDNHGNIYYGGMPVIELKPIKDYIMRNNSSENNREKSDG